MTKIFVPGGAGYKGGVLIPKLLAKGYEVVVYDLYIYGKEVFDGVRSNPRLTEIEGDVRDEDRFRYAVRGCEAVVHFACISNDPSCDLDPNLARSINYDSFSSQVSACKKAGVKSFIFASSSSVYGISDEPNVREDHPRVPITDYNRYKAMCEDVLAENGGNGFSYTVIRPATVCGYSPRLRLDLTVNILSANAVSKNQITVFGGSQYRPNIHIDDITDLYVDLLEKSDSTIAGQTYNAGYQNITVSEIAQRVKNVIETRRGREGEAIKINTTPSNDVRSYRITCTKLESELGFRPRFTIEDAASGLYDAFVAGKVPDAFSSTKYTNIKRMQEIGLK